MTPAFLSWRIWQTTGLRPRWRPLATNWLELGHRATSHLCEENEGTRDQRMRTVRRYAGQAKETT